MPDSFVKDPADGQVYVVGDKSEKARLIAKGYIEVADPSSHSGEPGQPVEPDKTGDQKPARSGGTGRKPADTEK